MEITVIDGCVVLFLNLIVISIEIDRTLILYCLPASQYFVFKSLFFTCA